jgi:hypothetical protein
LMGVFATLQETDYSLAPGLVPMAAVDATTLLLGASEGGVLRARSVANKTAVAPWSGGDVSTASTKTVGLRWDPERKTLHRTFANDAGLWIEAGDGSKAMPLTLAPTIPHALYLQGDSGSGEAVFLERNFETEAWIVRRISYGP